MNLTGRNIHLRKPEVHINPYRILLLLGLIFGITLVLKGVLQGDIKKPFTPTPTPTRTTNSYALEGETRFTAGDLNAAMAAYQQAVQTDPNNAQLYSELARIQTYSSASLSTDAQRKERLQQALDNINKAKQLAPEDSTVHAVRAFVLDWNANPVLSGENRQSLLTEAEQESVRALQLDNQNTLALAFYSEILADEMKWEQAQQYIAQALQRDPGLMDVHRINGQILESLGYYTKAIDEYKAAAKIMPNMTFLYIYIGANYRQLAANDPSSPYYESALEYFAKAADINTQLGIKDPVPYVAIAKTYTQKGDFLVSALNIRKAVALDPSNPDLYAQLGIVFFKSRNYEGAIPAFKCALRGCTAAESCEARTCDDTKDPQVSVQGMPLSDTTIVYYYTYGSVLSGLSRPSNNYCGDAMQVFKEIRAVYSGANDVMSIVRAGESICGALPTSTPMP